LKPIYYKKTHHFVCFFIFCGRLCSKTGSFGQSITLTEQSQNTWLRRFPSSTSARAGVSGDIAATLNISKGALVLTDITAEVSSRAKTTSLGLLTRKMQHGIIVAIERHFHSKFLEGSVTNEFFYEFASVNASISLINENNRLSVFHSTIKKKQDDSTNDI
jgi:putative heme degradation protein